MSQLIPRERAGEEAEAHSARTHTHQDMQATLGVTRRKRGLITRLGKARQSRPQPQETLLCDIRRNTQLQGECVCMRSKGGSEGREGARDKRSREGGMERGIASETNTEQEVGSAK